MLRLPSYSTIVIFVVALLICASVTALLLRNQLMFGMDKPDRRRKLHERPVSRLGGLPIFLTLSFGFLLAVLRFPDFNADWWPIILTNSLVFAVGFIDDLKPQGARIKLVGQVGAACILYALGVSIDSLSNPFGEGNLSLGWWSFPITVLWLIAIPNIINLIDGMDGLATGFGLFLCATLAFVGHFALMPDVVLVSVIMCGALAGFLVFNFPPARIFLGDGGAYLIGFFIASVSLMSSHKGSVIAGLLVMIIALGVPILDTLFAIIRRAIRGVPIFRADAEHIHHRLIMLGFSKAKALVALYSVCLVLSLFGISIFWSRGFSLPIAGAALCITGLLSARYLGYVKSWRSLREQINLALSRRREMLYTATYAKVIEWEAERSKDSAEFMPLLLLGMSRVGLSLTPGTGFKPVDITLANGDTCLVHVPDDVEMESLWSAKADLFAPALNVAMERWGALPNLEILRNGEHSHSEKVLQA
jgi:UDP-GlcNAc:undecaprenyl-phosphate/decaprenyl-phosphate GlcNAc-1-phosphate transferase